MVSRKRNKGKERKAKQVETKRAAVRNNWQGWVNGKACLGPNAFATISQCDHGFGAIIPDDNHPP